MLLIGIKTELVLECYSCRGQGQSVLHRARPSAVGKMTVAMVLWARPGLTVALGCTKGNDTMEEEQAG